MIPLQLNLIDWFDPPNHHSRPTSELHGDYSFDVPRNEDQIEYLDDHIIEQNTVAKSYRHWQQQLFDLCNIQKNNPPNAWNSPKQFDITPSHLRKYQILLSQKKPLF